MTSFGIMLTTSFIKNVYTGSKKDSVCGRRAVLLTQSKLERSLDNSVIPTGSHTLHINEQQQQIL